MSVTVIDGTSNTVIKTVAVGITPFDVALNPVTNKIYIPNVGSNNVTVIDGRINYVTKQSPWDKIPYFLVVNPVTNKVYVPNEGR